MIKNQYSDANCKIHLCSQMAKHYSVKVTWTVLRFWFDMLVSFHSNAFDYLVIVVKSFLRLNTIVPDTPLLSSLRNEENIASINRFNTGNAKQIINI